MENDDSRFGPAFTEGEFIKEDPHPKATNILKNLLNDGEIEKASDYFWANANIHFQGHVVFEALRNHPRFREFEQLYYDNCGEYVDQP